MSGAMDLIATLEGWPIEDLGMDDGIALVALLGHANRSLADLRDRLANHVAGLMDEKRVVVNGGVWEKSGRFRRTGWDNEQLLPTILDTRIFDRATGELVEETPLQKVLACWSLGTPRVTALRERGLDPDEWAKSEWAGWTIRKIG